MFKKLLSVILVCILAATMVAGCGGRANDEDGDKPLKSASDRADREERSSGNEAKKGNDTEEESSGYDEDKDDNDISGKVEKEAGEFKITIDPPKGWEEYKHATT